MSGLLADINSTGCCIWLALLSQGRPTVLFWRMCLVVLANLKIPRGYRNKTFKWNGCHVRDKKPCKMFCLQITLNPKAVSVQKNFWISFFSFIFWRQINLETLQEDFWLSKQSLTAFWFGILAQHYKYLCQRSWLESWNYFRCGGVIIRKKSFLVFHACLLFLPGCHSLLLKRRRWKANIVFLRFLMGRCFRGCCLRKLLRKTRHRRKKKGPLEEKQHQTGNENFHFLPAVCFSSSTPAPRAKESHALFPSLVWIILHW